MNKPPDLESVRYDITFDGFRWSGDCDRLLFYLRRPAQEKDKAPVPLQMVCLQARDLEFGMNWSGNPAPARSWDIDYVGSEKHGWFVKMDFRPHGSMRFYCKSIEILEP